MASPYATAATPLSYRCFPLAQSPQYSCCVFESCLPHLRHRGLSINVSFFTHCGQASSFFFPKNPGSIFSHSGHLGGYKISTAAFIIFILVNTSPRFSHSGLNTVSVHFPCGSSDEKPPPYPPYIHNSLPLLPPYRECYGSSKALVLLPWE